MSHHRRGGFTLIELLIVVAIIGILAAIAIPNFLQAPIRAKVSRAVSDFRSIDQAIKTYQVDTNSFPPCNPFSMALGMPIFNVPALERLSTPVQYLTSMNYIDPFVPTGRYSTGFNSSPVTNQLQDTVYKYVTWGESGFAMYNENERAYWFHLESAGPDRHYHNMSGILFKTVPGGSGSPHPMLGRLMYDPTNGTVSTGSIWRVGGQAIPLSPTNHASIHFYQAAMLKYGGG